MSLMPKQRLTAKKLAAIRSNGRRSRGPVTSVGKARAAAANLRHGYYAKGTEVALIALGEDPAEFKRRLESLIDTYQPEGALEISLVYGIACGLWRMERFHRMAESLAVKQLEKMQATSRLLEAQMWLSLNAKVDRLKEVFVATCMEMEASVGPAEMLVFEKAYADLPEESAKQVLRLLVSLRPSDSTAGLLPATLQQECTDEIPRVQAEERPAVRRELMSLLAPEIEKGEKRLLQPDEDPDGIPAQIERDVMLAKAQADFALLTRGEESCLRKVWRSTNLLMKSKKIAEIQKDVRNEECSN